MSRQQVGTSPRADELSALLAPYADPGPGQAGRLIHVPAKVAAAALECLPVDLRHARLNGTQPSMSWLVAQAADLGGLLVGSLAAGRAFVRFDGIQLGPDAAHELARRMATEMPGALQAALAEAWTSWAADEPTWTGSGTDLLDGALPTGAAVHGYWWD